MDKRWSTALWQQFGATIDMLENALLACPAEIWEKRLWDDAMSPPEESAEFWRTIFHTLYWLDFYLSGLSAEEFALPLPFTRTPKQPYTKEELHGYLLDTRKKCQTTIAALTDETAFRQIEHAWIDKKPLSFFELLLYTMRHVQEHTAQLSLFLGQNTTDHKAMDATLDWVARAKDQPSE